MVLTKSVLIILISVIGWTYAFSQTIEFEHSGIGEREAAEIEQLLNRYFSENARLLSDRILSLYRDKGYYDAFIDSFSLMKTDEITKVSLLMNEGESYRFGKTRLKNNDLIEEKSISNFKGENISKELIKNEALKISVELAEKGYPLAKVTAIPIIDNSESENEVDVEFDVEAGELIKIDSVLFRGNENTNSKFLLNEMQFKKGMKYDKSWFDRRLAFINRLGYISNAKQLGIASDQNGSKTLIINLEESSANRMQGIIGYIPEGPGGSDGYLTGSLKFGFGNLFGSGRILNASWDKEDVDTEELKLSYEEPYPFGKKVKVGLGFSQLVQDSSYVKRNSEVGLKFPFSSNLYLFASSAREKISVRDFGKEQYGLADHSILILTGGFVYDDRDFQLNPTSGFYYETSVSKTGKKEVGAKSVSGRKLALKAEYYIGVTKRSIISLALNAYNSRFDQGDVPFSDLFRVGGATTLRGYRENQFRGASVGWLNIEYRFITGKISRLFLFSDVGFISDRQQQGDISRYSYGAGIRASTAIGQIGIDFGIGEGDSFTNGKIHLSLNGAF